MSAAGTPVRVTVHGRVIAIDAEHPDDRALIAAILGGFPPAGTEAGAAAERYAVNRLAEGGWAVGRSGVMTHRAATIEDALLALEWQLVSDLLATRHERFHVHGAALADPTASMTVLVCGPSGAGKTTLTLALIAAGFQPYSDDVILIDPDALTPVTFERAFHVDAQTRRLVAGLSPPAGWELPGLPDGYFLPSAWARAPLPVGLMIFPRGRDVDQPLLVGLSVADAATALLSATGSLDSNPALALRAAARLTGAAPAFALYSGTLPATLELVEDAVGRILASRPIG